LVNFTVNNAIQSFQGGSWLLPNVSTTGTILPDCLPAFLSVTAAGGSNPLNVGIIIVIVFFIVLILAILGSFFAFKMKKRENYKKMQQNNRHNNDSSLMQQQPTSLSLNNSTKRLETSGSSGGGGGGSMGHRQKKMLSQQKPDIIEREVVNSSPLGGGYSPRGGDDLPDYSASMVMQDPEMPEHYDLENASSIAPSDIDIIYHYKDYREGGSRHHGRDLNSMEQHNNRWGKMITSSKMSGNSPIRLTSLGGGNTGGGGGNNNSKLLQSTPLARLSPSSELSHQTPRILTLHDISGKPLPSALLLQGSRQSQRSMLRGGGRNGRLTSSSSSSSLASDLNSSARVRRRSKKIKESSTPFDQPNNGGRLSSGRPHSSSLMSTPLESLEDHRSNNSSRLRKKRQKAAAAAKANKFNDLLDTNTDLLHDDGDSSSDSPSENDSFTCSEYEYDAPYTAGAGSKGGSGMIDSGTTGTVNGGMIFRKLTPGGGEKMRSSPLTEPMAGVGTVDLRGSLTTLNVSDDDLGSPGSSSGPASWEALLNWNPTFGAFVGVFKDIAELPDTDCDPELRPNPLGEGEGDEEEEYI
jgi:protocadherin Fat 4